MPRLTIPPGIVVLDITASRFQVAGWNLPPPFKKNNVMHSMRFPVLLLTLSFLAFLRQGVDANLRLPNIFGEGMVLQRDKPVAVWGWATPGAKVDVKFAGQSKTTTSDKGGSWDLKLDPMPGAAKPLSLKVTCGQEALNIGNILVGEVWICGGQSNMEWTLRGSTDADLELAAANFPAIRFIRLPKIARISPQDDFPVENPASPTGNWRQAVSGQVENFTAVGYYFARRLHRQLRVPVGIIDNSWGGTRAQNWCGKETLATIPEMTPDLEKFAAAHKAWIDGDLAVFNGAAQDQLTVHKAEVRYFDSIDTALKPYGLDLPPYP